MSITTISSREFNQNVNRAKKATRGGPVIITNRGLPEHVLMSVCQYQQITGTQKNILDLLEMPAVADIDFDIPRLHDDVCLKLDLS